MRTTTNNNNPNLPISGNDHLDQDDIENKNELFLVSISDLRELIIIKLEKIGKKDPKIIEYLYHKLKAESMRKGFE